MTESLTTTIVQVLVLQCQFSHVLSAFLRSQNLEDAFYIWRQAGIETLRVHSPEHQDSSSNAPDQASAKQYDKDDSHTLAGYRSHIA